MQVNIDELGMNDASDSSLLPSWYTRVDEPFYKGDGEHNVSSLQDICRQFKEYCHQQAIIKQKLIKIIKSNGNY